MRHLNSLLTAAAAALVTLLASPLVQAQTRGGAPEPWPAKDGAEVYSSLCQGCQMAQGKGAIGGGTYPALAANKNLASATYISYTVINGRKGMPPFGAMLSDTQVADVVNYLRTHFGNSYPETISAEEVKTSRPAAIATVGR
jgi:mono/diheme cytochrome c family protein